jgi:hypothetical protein
MRDFLAIVGGSVGLAVGYGITHDMVTAHLWLPYFTVHHVRLVESESPIVMALLWGVIATWWMGLILGVVVALAARVGRWPKLGSAVVLRRAAWLLAAVFAAAMAVILGIMIFGVVAPVSDRPPDWDENVRAVAVALAHQASYALSAAAGVGLATWTLLDRQRQWAAREKDPLSGPS